MIEARDLVFSYASDAGAGFSLRVERLDIARGERIALVGPSGSGKTTLLHLLAGILAPEKGTLRVAGVDLAATSDSERRAFRIAQVGIIFQELELLEHLNAGENILLPYRIHPSLSLGDEERARASELAGALGIGEKLDRRPARLSQGERQRVAVCRALVNRPRLLVADEPTSSLDAESAKRSLDRMFALVRDEGTTLVMGTHDASLLSRFDRVLELPGLAELPDSDELRSGDARAGTAAPRSARAGEEESRVGDRGGTR